MVYIDYVILKQSYDESFKKLNVLLDKKEEAFTRTLPNAIRYDLQKVIHSVSEHSPLDDYVMDIERIEEQIRKARMLVYQRKETLDLKEQELRASEAIDDRIYVLRFINHMKVDQIARKLNYSDQRSVYYHLDKIKHELKKAKVFMIL